MEGFTSGPNDKIVMKQININYHKTLFLSHLSTQGHNVLYKMHEIKTTRNKTRQNLN